jgi:hypothetical protein
MSMCRKKHDGRSVGGFGNDRSVGCRRVFRPEGAGSQSPGSPAAGAPWIEGDHPSHYPEGVASLLRRLYVSILGSDLSASCSENLCSPTPRCEPKRTTSWAVPAAPMTARFYASAASPNTFTSSAVSAERRRSPSSSRISNRRRRNGLKGGRPTSETSTGRPATARSRSVLDTSNALSNTSRTRKNTIARNRSKTSFADSSASTASNGTSATYGIDATPSGLISNRALLPRVRPRRATLGFATPPPSGRKRTCPRGLSSGGCVIPRTPPVRRGLRRASGCRRRGRRSGRRVRGGGRGRASRRPKGPPPPSCVHRRGAG